MDVAVAMANSLPLQVLQEAKAALAAVRRISMMEPIDLVSSQEDHVDTATAAEVAEAPEVAEAAGAAASAGEARRYLCAKPPFYDAAVATATNPKAVDTRCQSRLSMELKPKKAKAKQAGRGNAAKAKAKAKASASKPKAKQKAARAASSQAAQSDDAAPAYEANKFKDMFRQFVLRYRQEHGCNYKDACAAWYESSERAAIIGTLSAAEISRRRLARP